MLSVTSWFQFTHPGRGATAKHRRDRSLLSRFNSRTPGGVRPLIIRKIHQVTIVSIHAPREGCDS